MTTSNDLPAPAVRLITRFASTRRIPGTNRYARVCRSWQEAAADSQDQEQLQLLLALEALPADAFTSTSRWLAQHGQCVKSLYITYELPTAPPFQQLPLSTAPLVGLVRLEVDGPDSLVALAPALPQLVALTHLSASIGLICVDDSDHDEDDSDHDCAEGVFTANGAPLAEVPCLQQLCPGLKSLRLGIASQDKFSSGLRLKAPVAQLLPDRLEQLHIGGAAFHREVMVPCADLTPFTSLRCVTLRYVCCSNINILLGMAGLEEVDLLWAYLWVDGHTEVFDQWLDRGRCATPQHLAKLTHLLTRYPEPGVPSSSPQLSALPGLRKLHLAICESGAAAYVQQLSSLSRLQHLSLTFMDRAKHDAAAVLPSLSSVPQLTYLNVRTVVEVPASSWAAVLPHLTQLRVLGVEKEQLLEGLASEVARLTQLQCLYVGNGALHFGTPAVTCNAVAPYLHVMSKCSSLKAVLCWGDAGADDDTSDDGAWDGFSAARPMRQHVQEGQVHLSSWRRGKWGHAAEEGRVVCPRPCPHLPGVWELQ